MKRSNLKQSAMTLLEIMLVVAIIAMIMAAAVAGLQGKLQFAQKTSAKADIQGLSSSLLVYQSQNGFLPSTEQGLKALVTRPDTEPRPRQWTKLAPKIPIDPWGREYIYVRPGKHNTDSYDLYSAGPDNIPDTNDDICNWEKEDTK